MNDLEWCAYDLDECTVTLAFDNEEQVREFLKGKNSRNRIYVAPKPFDHPSDATWLDTKEIIWP